jgi:hypothetical protein
MDLYSYAAAAAKNPVLGICGTPMTISVLMKKIPGGDLYGSNDDPY